MRMHLVTGTRDELRNRTSAAAAAAAEAVDAKPGVVRWLVDAVVGLAGGGWTGERRTRKTQMNVLETLAVGPKKQLVLVRCGGERFLVGVGADSVQTIVRVGPEAAAAELSGVASQRGVWF